jgi:hypothetical protein
MKSISGTSGSCPAAPDGLLNGHGRQDGAREVICADRPGRNIDRRSATAKSTGLGQNPPEALRLAQPTHPGKYATVRPAALIQLDPAGTAFSALATDPFRPTGPDRKFSGGGRRDRTSRPSAPTKKPDQNFGRELAFRSVLSAEITVPPHGRRAIASEPRRPPARRLGEASGPRAATVRRARGSVAGRSGLGGWAVAAGQAAGCSRRRCLPESGADRVPRRGAPSPRG